MTWKPLRDDSHDATPVNSSIEILVKRLGGRSSNAQRGVMDSWAEAVGDDVAIHAQPISLVDGVLTVEVDDARWLTQLKWLGGRVADRLNAATESDLVERLNVRLTSHKSTKGQA